MDYSITAVYLFQQSLSATTNWVISVQTSFALVRRLLIVIGLAQLLRLLPSAAVPHYTPKLITDGATAALRCATTSKPSRDRFPNLLRTFCVIITRLESSTNPFIILWVIPAATRSVRKPCWITVRTGHALSRPHWMMRSSHEERTVGRTTAAATSTPQWRHIFQSTRTLPPPPPYVDQPQYRQNLSTSMIGLNRNRCPMTSRESTLLVKTISLRYRAVIRQALSLSDHRKSTRMLVIISRTLPRHPVVRQVVLWNAAEPSVHIISPPRTRLTAESRPGSCVERRWWCDLRSISSSSKQIESRALDVVIASCSPTAQTSTRRHVSSPGSRGRRSWKKTRMTCVWNTSVATP